MTVRGDYCRGQDYHLGQFGRWLIATSDGGTGFEMWQKAEMLAGK